MGGGGGGWATPLKNCLKPNAIFSLALPLRGQEKSHFFLTHGERMARQCVGLGRFAKANGMSVKRGFQVDADLVCEKKRDYTYLSRTGTNT